MSRRSMFKSTSTSDETFTQAAWDAAQDAQELWGASVEVVLVPSRRRGVWNVTARLKLEQPGQETRILTTILSDYPNSRAAALSSFLYSEMNKLLIMAAQKYNYEVLEKKPGF